MILTMFLTIPGYEKQRDDCTNESDNQTFVVCNTHLYCHHLRISMRIIFIKANVVRHVGEFPLESRRPWDQIILVGHESF